MDINNNSSIITSEIQPRASEKKTTGISLLVNSAYYFIECVFILHVHNRYRLVVLHNRRVLMDAYYRTIKGARIAFSKKYGRKAWTEGVKAEWTCFYDPDRKWLAEKVEV